MIAIVSCINKASDATVNFENIKVEKNSNALTSDSTYKVSVTYSNPVDAPVYLSDSIMKQTKLLLASWFDVTGKFDLNVSVKNHFDEYFKQVLENKFPEYNVFELEISPGEIFQNKQIISFIYNWVVYEGGAHNNFGKFCFTLDKKTGKKLKFGDLIKNEAEFLKIAETEFKIQSGIKENEEISNLYTFKDNKFHLADNFVFTPAGVIFYYNPYEIAPYAIGMIELALPYEKFELKVKS
jgi:hypothetical protein